MDDHGYLDGITMATPYRKTQHALKLQRLCREAWDPLMDAPVPESIREEVRVAAIRSAFLLVTDEEGDVLRKFGHIASCRSAILKVAVGGSAYAYLHLNLGCEIGVPARIVDRSGTMTVAPSSCKRSPWDLDVPVQIDEGIVTFFRELGAARRGYEAELARIVTVSRATGAPSTWRRMLDHMPVTRDHFASLIARPTRLAA